MTPTQLNPTNNIPYWVVIGDLHDKVAGLENISSLAKAAGVIITGDLTLNGSIAQARKVLEAIEKINPNIYAQIGNMDLMDVTTYLSSKGFNLHLEVKPLSEELAPNTAIMGLGGSNFTPFGTPSEFPESFFAENLELMWRKARQYKHVIMVSHTPPYDTLCDMLPNGLHVGSTTVRDSILETQPDVCLCGHIHEAKAIDRLGRSIIVNTGNFSAGGYAILSLVNNKFQVELF